MRRPLVPLTVLLLIAASLSGCIGPEENSHPQAFAGEDIEAEVGEAVVFSGSGLDSDGSLVRFRWDFDGDDRWDYTGETGAKIHVYSSPGSYEARFQVEDDEGARTEDTRWVNVTASVSITVAWSTGTGFKVHVPAALDVTRMEVDWTLEGTGPTPITRTFTHDAGLEKVNDTTYSFDPHLTSIEPGLRHITKVRLGQVVVASRTIDVVDASDASSQYDATYTSELWDTRVRDGNSTTLWRVGDLVTEVRTGWSRGHFNGNGSWDSYSNVSGVITDEHIALTDVIVETGEGNNWGGTWWYMEGNGTVFQWSAANFSVTAQVWDFVRAVENGSLTKDDWRRVGVYSGNNETNGTFLYTRESQGNQVRQNGEGDLYEVLKVRTEKSFDGTSQGLNFTLHNVTYDYDASRMIFVNRTTFRSSDQQVGFQYADGQWHWTNTTWGGFLDDDGNGFFNPDPETYDPELAAAFSGPRPRILQVGDTFTATNFYGVRLNYVAKRSDTAPLDVLGDRVDVTGVIAEAFHNSTWGSVRHWFWVLEDGPLPGFVYEERVIVERPVWGGGTYDWYRNIRSVRPLS